MFNLADAITYTEQPLTFGTIRVLGTLPQASCLIHTHNSSAIDEKEFARHRIREHLWWMLYGDVRKDVLELQDLVLRSVKDQRVLLTDIVPAFEKILNAIKAP